MWRSIADLIDIGFGLARIYRSEYWSAKEIRDYQERALIDQLRYAVTTIPYYRDLGIDPADIKDSTSLQFFPKLSKAIVQDQAERLCNPEMVTNSLFKSRTSGSSGEPTTTWFDRKCWNFCKYALKSRRTLEGGSPWRQRQLLFQESANPDGSVAAPVLRRFGPFRQLRLSIFTPVEEQLAFLLELKPNVLYGTPSGIKELCDYATQQGLRLPCVTTIFLSSELITDAVRNQIEASFRGRVVGIYGSTEFKDLAHQCEFGRYHVYFQSAFIECEAEGRHDAGRLQITSLINRAMPLIRFDIGDYADIGDDRCECGRNSPYLSNILGREIDFLELPDGRRISPYRLTTAVEGVPGLLKYRFIQNADYSLRMEVVFGNSEISDVERIRRIRDSLRGALGSATNLSVKSVDRIGRSKGGKHRIVTHSDQDRETCLTKQS